ncbi:Methionine--tRNA ligase, mitochondrial, partial [Frankliniella fusca]
FCLYLAEDRADYGWVRTPYDILDIRPTPILHLDMPAVTFLKRLPFRCLSRQFHSTTWKQNGFMVTTPIFYCNAAPHIGHLYTAVLADAACRFHELAGEGDSVFVTGTDEHGTKIYQAAAANKMLPKDYCDKISSEYRLLFSESEVKHSKFIRTTQPEHIEAVHSFWKRLKDGDFIYKGTYSGWYCVADEAFLADSQVKDGPTSNGNKLKVSVDSGQPVEWTTEENFMFRLSHFKSDLLDWLQSGNVVKPENFHRTLCKWLEETELEDLSISRPVSRVPWGIPVPDDSKHTVYVWLDALVNYLTAAGYPHDPNFQNNWPPHLQILGKDILKFHGIYWPAFLLAAGLKLPHQLLVHSHWTVESEKMSKSRGNVVKPPSPSNGGSVEEITAMRYFLLRTGTPHKDNNYSHDSMIHEANTDLMGAIGNLLNRCTGLALNPTQEYPPLNEKLPDCQECRDLMIAVDNLSVLVKGHYRECNFYLGIIEILRVIDLANQFFTSMAPWKYPKEDIAGGALFPIIHVTMEALRVSGIALQPVVPSLASSLLMRLGVPQSNRKWSDMEKTSWRGGPSASGNKLQLGQIKLFEKIGEKKREEKGSKPQAKKKNKTKV